MGDILVADGYSRAAAVSAALASGFELAERLRPYVGPAVDTLKRAWRDYSQVQYGPGFNKRRVVKRRKKAPPPPPPPPPSSPVLLGSNIKMSGAVEHVRLTSKVGRKRKRSATELFNNEIGRMEEHRIRWQNVSPSMVGPGARVITYGKGVNMPASTTLNRVLPIHFMSLTTFPGSYASTTPEALAVGARNVGMNRLVYRAPVSGFQGQFGYQSYQNQISTGGLGAVPTWHYEQGLASTNIADRAFHKWTDIRLNLYGALHYPMKYEVMLVTGMDEDMALLQLPPVTDGTTAADFPIVDDTPLGDFCRDMTRDLIGNPIIGHTSNRFDKGKYKVIYKKKVYVEPLANADAAIADVHTTNVKNLNIFIRHDRFRNYAWRKPAADTAYHDNFDEPGWDRTDIASSSLVSAFAEVDYMERVFLFIKCNSPLLAESDDYLVTSPVVEVPILDQSTQLPAQGSYDIVVRQSFRTSPLT